MESGTINANMLLAPSGRVEGELQLRDFYLKNEPAMRSLMDQGAHRYDDKGRVRYDPRSRSRCNGSRRNSSGWAASCICGTA